MGAESALQFPTHKNPLLLQLLPHLPINSLNTKLHRKMQKENHSNKAGAGPRPKASTLDILGGANHKRRINPKWREHYDRLRDLREQMMDARRTMASDAKEERSTYSVHMADAASDTYDSDWALSMLSSDQNALYEIEQAINRIENGSYGSCELTGKAIESDRLTAIPWTRFSMETQQQLEEQGAVFKTRLADRRGLADSEEPGEPEEAEEVAS